MIIPDHYKAQVKELLESGVRTFSFRFEDIQWVDQPTYPGRDAVFAPSLAARFADSEPDADVFFLDLYRMGSFRAEWLTELVTHPSGAFSDLEERFRPAFHAAGRLGEGASAGVYAVPWSAQFNALYYRSDLVPEPPKTLSELVTACERAADHGIPRSVRYCLLLDWESVHNDLYPLLWSVGSGDSGKLATEVVTSLLADLALGMGKELRPGFLLLPPARAMPEVGQAVHRRFAHGEAVMMVSWSNRYRFMRDEQSRDGGTMPPTGLAPLPSVTPGARWSNLGAWGWIVPRAPEKASAAAKERHDLAIRFVAELSSREAAAFFADRFGLIPARRDVPVPAELAPALAPELHAALDGRPTGNGSFQFRDRTSDEFVHVFLRDALKDVLTCPAPPRVARVASRVEVSGECRRYLNECLESGSGATEDSCLRIAIGRRLQAADREIDAVHGHAPVSRPAP